MVYLLFYELFYGLSYDLSDGLGLSKDLTSSPNSILLIC